MYVFITLNKYPIQIVILIFNFFKINNQETIYLIYKMETKVLRGPHTFYNCVISNEPITKHKYLEGPPRAPFPQHTKTTSQEHTKTR